MSKTAASGEYLQKEFRQGLRVVQRVFDEISFPENKARVSRVLQFRESAKITKETSFAKHENRKKEEIWK